MMAFNGKVAQSARLFSFCAKCLECLYRDIETQVSDLLNPIL